MGAIHQQAVQGGVAVAGGVGADPKRGLVGRSAELGQIRLAVRQATGGSGQAILVTGEAGIGKTRVVAEGLDDASRSGVQVFRGAAEELERRRPFGAITDCLGIGGSPLDGRRAAIARLLAEDSDAHVDGGWFGESPQAEFRLVEAVVALVEELSTRGPVMVAVEDLQWADPSTLLVLQRLGRRVGQLPVLLVATARPVPRSQELERCIQGLRASGATELLLGPLDGAAMTRLVEQLVGAPPGPGLLRQVAGAGGNPLFVTELVGALQRDGSIELESDGTAELTSIGIPAALPLLILHRLSFLAPATLELLQVASVLGSSFAVADLSAVTGRPTAGLLAALEEAIAAGILESRGELLGFRHDLIWEALYQDLAAPMRRGLHLDAGRALAAAGAPPEQVAEQLVRGASAGDRQAVAWLRRAAQQAAPQAPGVAVELLQRALELADPTDPVRDGLLAEQAVSLMWSGRLVDAEAVCREVLGRGHLPEVDAMLRLCLVQTLLGRGRIEDVLKEADAAVATPQLSASDRVRFQAFKASALASFGQLEAAGEVAAQVRPAAEETGDELAGCICLATLALVTNLHGDFVGALNMAKDAVRLADLSAGLAAHRFRSTCSWVAACSTPTN
jgi:hypothetical protein